MRTRITICLTFFFMLSIVGCNIQLLSPETDSESANVNGWRVMYGPTTSAEKTLEGSAETVTVSFVGDPSSINDLLSGAWEIKAGMKGSIEELLFASMQDTNTDRIMSNESQSAGITVSITPKNRSKGMALGGLLVSGSWITLTRSGIWWGMSAWTEPANGNIDLYLHMNDWGIWREVDKSVKPGLTMDDVGHTHWIWWVDYRLKIVAEETSTYTGWVSW